MSDINMNKEVETSDQGTVDFSDLITSANLKRYLQLVPTTSLSDDDDQHTDDHLYDNPASPPSPSYEDKRAGGDIAEQQIKEWQDELEKVEGEINMLRQVLGSKVRRATELKRNLGITPFKEFKQDLQSGFQQIKDSSTFQKTSAAVKTASEKTSSALSSVGAVVSKKIGDIKNSQTFKSMEERVETAYASVKSKVSGSKSTEDIDAAFQDAAESSSEAGTPDAKIDPTSIPPKDNVPL